MNNLFFHCWDKYDSVPGIEDVGALDTVCLVLQILTTTSHIQLARKLLTTNWVNESLAFYSLRVLHFRHFISHLVHVKYILLILQIYSLTILDLNVQIPLFT